jgi:hypothetical protein
MTLSGQTSKIYTFTIKQQFDTQNKALIQWLDTMVQECLTISLEDSNEYCEAVSRATLAGGYAHLLCSPIRAMEQVQTIRDGNKVQNELTSYNLHRHFQYLVICRLHELLQDLLVAVRFKDPEKDFLEYTSDAFASAGIVRYEIGYFKRTLRNGELSSISIVCLPSISADE